MDQLNNLCSKSYSSFLVKTSANYKPRSELRKSTRTEF